jgi:hypothetical protein
MEGLLRLLDLHRASACVLSTEAVKDLLALIGRHVALRKSSANLNPYALGVCVCGGACAVVRVRWCVCVCVCGVLSSLEWFTNARWAGGSRGMRARCSRASLAFTTRPSPTATRDPRLRHRG